MIKYNEIKEARLNGLFCISFKLKVILHTIGCYTIDDFHKMGGSDAVHKKYDEYLNKFLTDKKFDKSKQFEFLHTTKGLNLPYIGSQGCIELQDIEFIVGLSKTKTRISPEDIVDLVLSSYPNKAPLISCMKRRFIF